MSSAGAVAIDHGGIAAPTIEPRVLASSVDDRLVVLYDRDCGLCTATARQLRRWDRAGRIALIPLQEVDRRAPARVVEAVAGLPLACAIHAVDARTGRVTTAGDAVLAIARALPGGRTIADLVAAVPPSRWILGVVYDLVARNRHGIGRALRLEGPACDIPR